MAREKTVYTADMVCHLWANRHPVSVRTPTGNLFTSGSSLYSYGNHFVIAAFLDNPAEGGEALIIWNDSSTTCTTNKHRSHAFRALSSYQRQRLIRCDGGLDRNSVENRGLPLVAKANIDYALGQLEKALSARQRRDSYIGEAVRAFSGAVSIYKYIGDGKAVTSVPVIPANPTNEQLADIVRTAKKAELNKKALESLESLKTSHSHNAERVGNYDFWVSKGEAPRDENKPAEILARALHNTGGLITRTIDAYKLAGLNVSSLIPKIKKENAAMLARFKPLADAEIARVNCAAMLKRAHAYSLQIAVFKPNEKHGKSLKDTGGHFYARTATRENFINRGFYDIAPVSLDQGRLAWLDANECTANIEFINRIIARASNIVCHKKLADNIQAFNAWKESAIEFIEGKASRVPYRFTKFDYALSFEALPYFIGKIEAIKKELDSLNVQILARNAVIHAENIQKWRNGENVTIPRDVPVMARIKGDIVETSWGAHVPLDHAARLVRIAQRVAARGGMTYTTGTGPRVGHFQVNRIGSDLSALIGCHSFNSSESALIIPLILQAAENAGIVETLESTNT